MNFPTIIEYSTLNNPYKPEAARGWGQVGPMPHLINVSVPQFNSLCPTCDAFVPHQ